MKPVKLTGIQYAALPYRIEARQAQILLITSRGTRRWVIPKGWPIRGLTAPATAATEAAEEAGVTGEIAQSPLGSYRYLKRLQNDHLVAVQVIVFPLRVAGAVADFKEEGQRVSRWFRYQDAARMVAEPSLRRLIREFGETQAPSLLQRGLRAYRIWRFGVGF